MSARIEFSEMTWSTCFNLMISTFLSILRAKNDPSSFFLVSLTRPNEPITGKVSDFQVDLEKVNL